MIARVSTFAGTAEQMEQAAATFRAEVLPWLRDATGFRGALILNDGANGRALALTFWSDEGIARDQDASGMALRDVVASVAGMTTVSVEFYEVAAAEELALDAPG